jgi:hypothetical protein
MRAWLALLVVGCGGRVIDSAGSDQSGVGGVATPPDSAAPAEDTSPSVDTATAKSDAGPPTSVTPGCGEELWGGSQPDTFKSYEFMTQPVCDVPEYCYFIPHVEASCEMRVQFKMDSRTFKLSDADCAWLKRMTTSEAMRAKLSVGPYPCESAAKTGGPIELLTIATVARTYNGKYNASCKEEPLVTHRRCIVEMVQKYWPEVKL